MIPMHDPSQLDEESVSLVLQHVAANLSRDNPAVVTSEEDAAELVKAVLASQGRPAPTDILERSSDPDVARRLLALLRDDPAARDQVEDLLQSPPRADQAMAETIAMSAVVLGATVAWLQTNIGLRVSWKDGKLQVDFDLRKEAANAQIIQKVVAAISSLFPH